MKVVITPTATAKEHHPTEPFNEVEVLNQLVPIDVETEISNEQYAALVAFSYDHPDNGLKCKCFTIKVINLADNQEPDADTKAVIDQTRLFAAVYLSLANGHLKDVGLNQTLLTQASIAIYNNIQPTKGELDGKKSSRSAKV